MQQNAKSIVMPEKGLQGDKCDPSILQKPLNLGVRNIHQILKCIQNGSSEVKDIILNECNVIYECKICRNLFRSLPNLLSHKRFYCKEHCCESMVIFADVERDESTIIVQPESPPDDVDEFLPDNSVENEPVNNDVVNGSLSSSSEDKKPEETNVIGNSSPKIFIPSGKRPRKTEPKKLTINDENNTEEKLNSKPDSNKIKRELIIQPINGNNNAVFQTLNDKGAKVQKSSPQEEKAVSGKKIIVIIPKHTTTSTKTEQSNNKQTSPPFSSRRKALAARNDCDISTLTCLKCTTTYTSLKTLYLHMMNLHAKRRLYYPCPFCKTSYVQIWGVSRHLMTVHKKSKDQAVKLRNVIKKRAFLKPFDKDATGESKSQGNSPQNSTNRCTKPMVSPSSSVQIHKCSKCNRVFTRKTSRISHEKFCGTKPKTPLSSTSQKKTEISTARPKRVAEKKLNRDFINSQTLKWRSANKVDTSCIKSAPQKDSENNIKSKLMAIINPAKLSCTKCHKRFSNFPNLKRHAAIHLGWTRFKCRHCSFQSYQKSQCRSHIERNHKGLSNPENIEKLIISLENNKTTNDEKSSVDQIANSSSKVAGNNAKATCKDNKDNLKNKHGKSSPSQSSSSSSPDSKKLNVSSPTKANVDNNIKKSSSFDSNSEKKVFAHNSIPPSPALNSRQITTRLSMRTLEEENSNFAKFYSTLVTRSTSYPKLDLLLGRQTSPSTKEKTESEPGTPDKKTKLENHCRIDVLKPEKTTKQQNCVPPFIVKCNPHFSELP